MNPLHGHKLIQYKLNLYIIIHIHVHLKFDSWLYYHQPYQYRQWPHIHNPTLNHIATFKSIHLTDGISLRAHAL